MIQKTIGKYRWTICALVFMATTINYLDRTVISFLKPYFAKSFGWDATEETSHYADMEMAFKLAYSFGFLIAGRVIDRLGSRIGYAVATAIWSLAAIAHAFATGAWGLIAARGTLGVAESGNFPAAIKAVAEWFPKKERALATGIFNSGANIGAIIVPFTVPMIAEKYGWQLAFIFTGAIGFLWLILWFIYFEVPARQKKLSREEYDYIHSDPEEAQVTTKKKVGWGKLLTFRQTWAFAIGKFLTDPIWWFYIFWLPDFLRKQYGLQGDAIIWPSAIPFIIASVGSIFGGWLPLKFINSGWAAFRARKTSMLIYAFFVIPIVFAQYVGQMHMWYAILVIALAMSAHQAWSANIFTTVSDMFPKTYTASVTGIGGLAGGLGGFLLTALVQKRMFVYYESIGQVEKGYFIMFIICGSAYLVAWFIMHILVPRMKPIQVD